MNSVLIDLDRGLCLLSFVHLLVILVLRSDFVYYVIGANFNQTEIILFSKLEELKTCLLKCCKSKCGW